MDEEAAKNPKFKKVHDHYMAFRRDQVLWFRVAENGFDNFMARQSAAGSDPRDPISPAFRRRDRSGHVSPLSEINRREALAILLSPGRCIQLQQRHYAASLQSALARRA